MLALVVFLIIILGVLVVLKIGSISLELTGLSQDVARFQTYSAFLGVGFTTSEAEMIMVNPVRRKILRVLMLFGSAGLTTAIATLVFAFMNTEDTTVVFGFELNGMLFKTALIFCGLVFLLVLFSTPLFDKLLRRVLEKKFHIIRRSMVYDYETLFGLSKGYGVVTFEVPKRHWMVNKTVGKLEINKEGVIILGLYRKVKDKEIFIGLPSKEFKIHNKDKVIAYGKEDSISNLAKRPKGILGQKERKEAEEIHKEDKIIRKIEEDKIKVFSKKKGIGKKK